MTQPTKRRSLPVLPVRAAAAPDVAATPGAVTSAGGARLGLVTLGCDKNSVDSERILGRLQGAGVGLAARAEDADIVVINTCGFIDVAKQESIDMILEAVRLKDEGRVRAVVAMGCLVQRYKHELEAEIPEVDLFLGLAEVDRLVPELEERGLVEAVGGDTPLMERPLRVHASSTPHTAHLKISEGCDHGCAFCAIPLMRGKFRSTPPDILLREAQELEAAGVMELNIVSQDTTWYGRDWARGPAPPFPEWASGRGRGGEGARGRGRGGEGARGRGGEGARGRGGEGAVEPAGFFVGRMFDGMAGLDLFRADGASRPGLASIAGDDSGPVRDGPYGLGGWDRTGALPVLLRTLLETTAIPWLRLFYMYPSGITPALVELLASEPRLLPYLDMPIQHGSDRMLERMRRPERRRTILERARWLRQAVPEVALRTTVIVGFPGETEEDVEALVDLLDEVRFDHLGAFAYSEEDGTPASSMDGALPQAVRRERLERVLDVQRSIAQAKDETRLGRVVRVLVDEIEEGGSMGVGRGEWQALEVDGVVRFPSDGDTRPGDFVDVRLTGVVEHDFEGVIDG